MTYDYDLITIGLGPAGMAVSVMGAEMGLKVCAIEKHKIGGECMNVGCIPSKSLLRMAKVRAGVGQLSQMALEDLPKPAVGKPFQKIQQYIKEINEGKTVKMFEKVDLVLGEGAAEFCDPHTVCVGERKITAKRIFIATGTKPMMPPILGLDTVDEPITNMNVFSLPAVPQSMIIIGGGAIGSEMAQAFARLGCACSIVQMDPHLIPVGDEQAGRLLEETFQEEGIAVYNGKKITEVGQNESGVFLKTEDGLYLTAERLMVAAGRHIDLSSLKLENAGIDYGKRGVVINRYLQSSQKHIYAVGDCNGKFLLSHAAMHQGMIALMNSMMPLPFMRMTFDRFEVPWTVFTEPQVSYAGMREKELKEKGFRYDVIQANYEDYGAAIAENITNGFVKAFVSPWGRIYGVSIVGEGSGEMINEWALAIQKKVKMYDIMLQQHSFPTMGFLTKRVAEMWMMKKMKYAWVQSLCRFMFRINIFG